ncbi:hypothetical protein L2X99_09370 [Microbacterium sp. KUDC0406]|uniref:hypothetical protein n=1 Tax=Microbacterium sp. KUDC0406 TaxID=2909588 RepID=UPI001F310B91|nr:hypothetical protein [Microbacterium sp. KUDC0406]UJP08731.1 hypothetical protein L2X99_09370 [Microbacterium sp. KUDC0406]
MAVQHSSAGGVLASIAASVLFGGMFLLAGLVSVSAEVVFAWRVLLGERMQGADVFVYGILAVALTVLAVDGFRVARRTR